MSGLYNETTVYIALDEDDPAPHLTVKAIQDRLDGVVGIHRIHVLHAKIAEDQKAIVKDAVLHRESL